VRRRSRDTVEAPGQDSFLDIVANLVGILIILVMVVGVRTRDAMIRSLTAKAAIADAVPQPTIDVSAAKAAAEDVEANINGLTRKIETQQASVALRRMERDQVHVLITALERQLAQRREQLDDADRQKFDMQNNLASARSELEDLRRSRQVVENSAAPTAVIQHLPTPMAKTVFGKEIHFRLLGGRIAYVPWDELVEKLKAEAPQKVWKLKDAPRISETIGPERGFLMKYTLRRAEYKLETKMGTAIQSGVELEQFTLQPVSENLGQPLTQALQPGSDFRQLLDGLDPNRYTITVWVYPDSFEQFRTLKQDLYQRGFLTASRPLPENQPIGGAPTGTRSVAQ
jgi:hypothetical protein